VTDAPRSEPTWLSRALRPITEVHPGEAVTALLLTLNVFLLLSAYYVIKPVREAWILALDSGAEYKSYASGVIAVILLLIIPAYGKLVDRLPRIKLVIVVSLAFAAQLVLFYLAAGIPSWRVPLALIFFAWVGIFNVMVVAQFWAYANDLYSKEQGDRLFPMIALGASIGAAVSSILSDFLIDRFGVQPMPLIAAGLLLVCTGLVWFVEQREGTAEKTKPAGASDSDHAAKEADPLGGFGLVRKYRYLLLIALFAIVYNWVNSNSEYMLSKLVKGQAAAEVASKHLPPEAAEAAIKTAVGKAYAQFFWYVNAAGVLLQMFVVSRLVRWFKLSKAFLFMPVVAFGNAFVFAFFPIAALAKGTKAAENAVDYSLNNTLKQMLWLVTSPQMKYKAKQVVDTFCVRIGDVFSALSVGLAANVLHLSVPHFAWISLALAGIWLSLALAIGRQYHELEERKEKLGA
jgi:AAA family ATP:ADP antiporter